MHLLSHTVSYLYTCLSICLCHSQVEEKFEEMLTDMNLTDDTKKAPLRAKSLQEKRAMLAMQYRGSVLQVCISYITVYGRSDQKKYVLWMNFYFYA